MGLLDFFKKKKDKEEDSENVVATCFICNNPIKETEDYKVLSWNKQKYHLHKKCFKQLKRLAIKNIGFLS